MTGGGRKSDAEWREKLTSEQYRVTRQKATEPPFTGKYNDCKTQGIYHCVCCSAELFSSEAKFESGTGWPSFHSPHTPQSVATEDDDSLGVRRIEALCRACGAHLGHVFPDGPRPTGQRYCINSAALELEKREDVETL